MNGVRKYIAARDAKPMTQLGDIIHGVNAGSEFEGTLLLSELRAFVNAHDELVGALRAITAAASTDVSDTAIIVGSDAKAILAFAREALAKAS